MLAAVAFGRHKHLIFRFAASRRLHQLKKHKTDREKFDFLKTTHHFTFEEMILSALKRHGHKIQRSKKYSGDGGIDGQCWINGQHYLIQAKRYKNHINPAHVGQFVGVCRRQDAKGLFIHTGKTGAKSRNIARKYQIKIISGRTLLKLFRFELDNRRNTPQ